MASFSLELGKILKRPTLLTVPGPLLKLLLGDGAKIVLEGQHVSSIYLNRLRIIAKIILIIKQVIIRKKESLTTLPYCFC